MNQGTDRTLSLVDALATFRTKDEFHDFLKSLSSPSEYRDLEQRWRAVQMLLAGFSQRHVRDALGISIATVSRASRVAQQARDIMALPEMRHSLHESASEPKGSAPIPAPLSRIEHNPSTDAKGLVREFNSITINLLKALNDFAPLNQRQKYATLRIVSDYLDKCGLKYSTADIVSRLILFSKRAEPLIVKANNKPWHDANVSFEITKAGRAYLRRRLEAKDLRSKSTGISDVKPFPNS